MKDEQRLLIAFAASVLVILLFGMLSPKRPLPTQAPKETSAAQAPAPPAGPAAPEGALGRLCTFSGGDVSISNDVLLLTVNQEGAKVRDVGLLRYRRPGEELFRIFAESGTLAQFPEGSSGGDSGWDAPASLISCDDTSLVLKRTPRAGLSVIHRYTCRPGSYVVTCETEFLNTTAAAVTLENYLVTAGTVPDIPRTAARDASASPPQVLAGNQLVRYRRPAARISSAPPLPDASWVCIKSGYGMLFLHSREPTGAVITREGDRILAALCYPRILVEPGAPRKLTADLYAGPTDPIVAAGETALNLAVTADTGIFSSLGRLLTHALTAIHRAVPNWGWAIILLTLLVKLALFPVSRKGLQSMRQMQKLRPYMQDLQKKYKDNPQQMQKELMNLYREYKINPMGGCLPMLVQFPVFIAFFISLRNSIVLRGAPFILWIRDLSMPDTFLRLPVRLPGIGDSINLLPLIMGGTFFWQQRLTPSEPSQKMLNLLMPLLFLVMFYNFASGLLLYWVTMNLAGIVEQYVIQKGK